MKGNMLIFAALCLLLCWMLPVGSKKIPQITVIVSQPEANPSIQMSMVEDAVDDMYSNCNAEMMKMVKDKYFKAENNGIFANVWTYADKCANKSLKHKDKGDEALTRSHMLAICAYTTGYKRFYEKFNNAVRTNRLLYLTSFPFHSFHFWLTSAVQILSNNKHCHTTYRRTKSRFIGKVDQKIRFGFFASSSFATTLTQFGTKTCFKIKTCSGAPLKHYSDRGNSEQEVLIPPYEMFNITKKMKNKHEHGLSDCEVVYILESVGVQSNVNCDAAY